MFTGLIAEIGRVDRCDRQPRFQRLEVSAVHVLEGLRIGDSVAIAGVCQTVVELSAGSFVVEAVAETLGRTTLGQLRVGDRVNLEPALRLADPLGGHLVLGHVDGIGRLAGLQQGQHSWELRVELPAELERYSAPKGSITVDGISLTIVAAVERHFTVSVIPHTFEHTTLADRRVGDPVNLEVDIIARYVERLLQAGQSPAGLSWDRLRQMGY